ncbi:MAG TPA: choice-of-anchor Q domain-containing protein, partial [Vicinamibacterales bacterium]|nr:choice-of-anchor Q domain-containing protein [Vicinamibacterales bacterium]
AILLAGLASVGTACAATVCVATSDELTAALAAAQAEKTSSHEIRIHTGHYIAPPGGWHVDVHQTGTIVISGGFQDGNCQTQTQSPDASLTRLDGNQAVRPLTIATSFDQDVPFNGGQIAISGLTFENGSGDSVAGLKISDSGPIYNGSILIERNVFRDNVAAVYQQDNSAGALLAATDGPDFSGNVFMIVRDNLFAGNRAPEGAAALLFSNNSIDVNDNTFTDNQTTGIRTNEPPLAVHTPVAIFTLAQIIYSNNIFWGNNPENVDGTFDLRADSTVRAELAADLFNNDTQTLHGTPRNQDGNTAVDPGFVDAAHGDFRLIPNSPLVDAGKDDPDGGFATVALHGVATAVDLQGEYRVQGLHHDIGAYESGTIFQNGFD